MQVDNLSNVVDGVRFGTVAVRHLHRDREWTLALESFAGIGFHDVTRGVCNLILADGRPISLAPGDIAVLGRGSSHTLASVPGSDADAVELLCGAYRLGYEPRDPVWSRLPEVVVINAAIHTQPDLWFNVTQLDRSVNGTAPGAAAAQRAALDLILVQALRVWQRNAGDTWLSAVDGQDPVVAQALTYLHQRPESAWTAANLSAAVGLSRAALTRRFTLSVGMPPMTYLTRRRMTVACQLLRSTSIPLAAVADKVGYASQYSFASAFRREMGLPPGEFRRSA